MDSKLHVLIVIIGSCAGLPPLHGGLLWALILWHRIQHPDTNTLAVAQTISVYVHHHKEPLNVREPVIVQMGLINHGRSIYKVLYCT